MHASAARRARESLETLSADVQVSIGTIAVRACPVLPPTIEERIADNRAQTIADSVMYREALATAAERRGGQFTGTTASACFATPRPRSATRTFTPCCAKWAERSDRPGRQNTSSPQLLRLRRAVRPTVRATPSSSAFPKADADRADALRALADLADELRDHVSLIAPRWSLPRSFPTFNPLTPVRARSRQAESICVICERARQRPPARSASAFGPLDDAGALTPMAPAIWHATRGEPAAWGRWPPIPRPTMMGIPRV